MNSIEIAVVILTFIFGGALLGMSIGRKVPRHLTPETKAVVTAAMAVIGTMTALVIGLLISTASTSFSARNEALSRMSADVVQLDQLLRRYGPAPERKRTTTWPAFIRTLWVAKYKSGGDRSLKQTAAMWPPRVTVKRGWNS